MFKRKIRKKSNTWQVIFANGGMIEIAELTNPPKLIILSKLTVEMFAKTEYKLKVLK